MLTCGDCGLSNKKYVKASNDKELFCLIRNEKTKPGHLCDIKETTKLIMAEAEEEDITWAYSQAMCRLTYLSLFIPRGEDNA